MQLLNATCPMCGHAMTVGVDDSTGSPDEAGQECLECGSISVWYVVTTITYTLGKLAHCERVGPGKPHKENSL